MEHERFLLLEQTNVDRPFSELLVVLTCKGLSVAAVGDGGVMPLLALQFVIAAAPADVYLRAVAVQLLAVFLIAALT